MKVCLILVILGASTPCFSHNCAPIIRESVRVWMAGYPINSTSLNLAQGRLENALELWESLVIDLASTAQFSTTENSIVLRVSNPGRQISRFRMPPHLFDSWKSLGLLNEENRFNLNLRFDDYLNRLRTRLHSQGLAIEPFGPDPLWWKGPFLSGYEFSSGILSGSFPVDDLHAVLFHGPDLIHPERGPIFIWALKWIQLESFLHSQFHRRTRRDLLQRTHAEWTNFSFHFFHAYFEGRQIADSLNQDFLPGFIRLIQPNIRGRIERYGDEFWTSILTDEIRDLDPLKLMDQIRRTDFPAWGDSRRFWLLGAKIARAQTRQWRSRSDFNPEHLYVRGERLDRLLSDFERSTDQIIRELETSLESASSPARGDAPAH